MCGTATNVFCTPNSRRATVITTTTTTTTIDTLRFFICVYWIRSAAT
jgi:hypothetical protein